MLTPRIGKTEDSAHYTLVFSRLVIASWILSIALVSYLSLIPGVEPPVDFRYADKLLHALAYAWLALLPFLGFGRTQRALVASLLMMPWGTALEIGQAFVPERFASLSDAFANSFGILLGIISGIWLRRLFQSR